MVFEEADEKFWVGVGLTRSERYLMISIGSSKLTSETWLLDASRPDGRVPRGRAAPARASSTASSTRSARTAPSGC